MSTVRFKARGSDGRVAIWRDGSDEDPFDEPLAHLDRVLFHSDLNYPVIVSTHTGTLSLPAQSANTETNVNHPLFAHNLGGIPFVLGYVTIEGNRVPLAGSVPIAWNNAGVGRWLNLGADETNVCIHESSTALSSGYPAVDVDWTVFVTDVIVS